MHFENCWSNKRIKAKYQKNDSSDGPSVVTDDSSFLFIFTLNLTVLQTTKCKVDIQTHMD